MRWHCVTYIPITPPTSPYLGLEGKGTVTFWQSMTVLPPTNTEGKRANSWLIMNDCTGFSGFLLLSSTARTVAELQTGPRAPLPGPALPPRARACSGKDERCSRLYSTRQAPAPHPPDTLAWGSQREGDPPPRWTSPSPGPGNHGFFLSHLWESVSGRALASEAAQAGPHLAAVALSLPGQEPGPGASLPNLPTGPTRSHLLQQPRGAMSNQAVHPLVSCLPTKPPEAEAASPVGSGTPLPLPFPAPPSRLVGVASAAPWWNPGDTAGRTRGNFLPGLGAGAAAFRFWCWDEGKGFEGNRTRAALRSTDLDRGTYLKPLSLKGFI